MAPFMDREKVTKPAAQIGFIKFVLLPMFETVAEVKNFIIIIVIIIIISSSIVIISVIIIITIIILEHPTDTCISDLF